MRPPDQPMPLFWPVASIVLVLDTVTKLLAQSFLSRASQHDVLGDFVRLTLRYNPGAAFGLHLGSWSRVVFSGFAVIAIVVLQRMYRDTPRNASVRVWALAVVTGGAASNGMNRVWSPSGVVDFLDVGIGAARWPTFNLADVAISVGVIQLAIVFSREGHSRVRTRL